MALKCFLSCIWKNSSYLLYENILCSIGSNGLEFMFLVSQSTLRNIPIETSCKQVEIIL